MPLDFGKVENYKFNGGYGFVSCTFAESHKGIFFNIKTIKGKYPELAQQLDQEKDVDSISFWYDIEITSRGQQVHELWLDFQDIPEDYQQEIDDLKEEIQKAWQDLESPKPSWLDDITTKVFDVDFTEKLNKQRELDIKKIKEQAQKQKEQEISRLSRKHSLPKEHAKELYLLLVEMRPLEFRFSAHLSQYIVRNKLGHKYPNISGIVRMENSSSEWNFHGGFPPHIYAIVCDELGLKDKNTDARATGFTPFKDID